MIETVIRKRIEILTDTALVRRVTAAIDSVGITLMAPLISNHLY